MYDDRKSGLRWGVIGTIFVLLIVFIVFWNITGCYAIRNVATDQVAARLRKNAVHEVVGPGVYTDFVPFSRLKKISVATMTFEVEDIEVATKDNQLVGVRITIQAQRMGDTTNVKNILTNWSPLLDDDRLKETIDANAREGIKNGTRQFTLMELLDDRNGLADAITTQLQKDTDKYSANIVNVTIENIAIAPEYAQVLQQTAKLLADQKYQEKRQDLIEQQASTDLFEREQAQLVLAEQLLVENAQTLVDVEIASRQGKKTQAAQEIYLVNEKAYQLEYLDRLADVMDNGFLIIPEGTDLMLFLSELADGMTPIPYGGE